MFKRSFFLLRLIDVEGVRVTECNEGGYKNAISVRAGGCGMLECGDIGEGKQMGEGALRGVLQVELKGVARQVNGGSDCMKDVFSRVLEFGGHGVLCRVQIIESGKARWDKVVYV
jgi:hypothetical protein